MRNAHPNEYVDFTRSSFERSDRVYLCSTRLEKITRLDVFMALDSPQTMEAASVHVCTGEPGELFAGVLLERNSSMSTVKLGCGSLWLFTTHYDVECHWQARNDCLVVLGPEGTITVGKFPDDVNVAIGRVFSEPSATDPYLGVRVFGWG